MINNHNHFSRKKEAYKRIASIETLFNETQGVSFSSCRYSEVKKVTVRNLGGVYLAPKEETVILPDETKANVKRLGLTSVAILNACNNFEEEHAKEPVIALGELNIMPQGRTRAAQIRTAKVMRHVTEKDK